MSQQFTRILFALLSLPAAVTVTFGQKNLTAKAKSFQPATVVSDESDRARDGLLGPVRRVRTEVVRLSTVGGKTVEDNKRVLLESGEYDLKGTKTQTQYFPVAGSTLTGREVYKYDDKGNISEMTLVNADGSLVSKEVYKYEYDSVGNWVKMTTSVAVVESSKIDFEPTEVTYRTIFYYLDASMAKMLQPSTSSASSNSTVNDEAKQQRTSSAPVNEVKASASVKTSANKSEKESRIPAPALPPATSVDKLKASPIQPLVNDLGAARVNVSKKVEVSENDAPPPHPLLKPLSGGVLNGMALSLPAPAYPDIARRMRVTGLVEVEVILDETGKVISARALSGPATLREVAVQAAYRARFSPTKLSGLPVKVSGQINYNFTMPQ